MAAASGALHIEFTTLQTIKALGCPAFRWGKVYEKPLREWIDANKTTGDEPDDFKPTEIQELADKASFQLWRAGRSSKEMMEEIKANNPIPK